MALAAGTRHRLRFKRHDLEVVGQPAAGLDGIQTRGENRVLRGDARRVAAFMPVIIGARRCAERAVFLFEVRIIVAKRNQCRGADGHRVGAQGQRLGNVGARADAARHDELHLAMHAEILQRLHRRTNAGEDRQADVLDEDFLRGGGAALHAVQHHDIGAGLHRECHVIVRTRAANLHVDRLFP